MPAGISPEGKNRLRGKFASEFSPSVAMFLSGADFSIFLFLVTFKPCIINEMAKNTESRVQQAGVKVPGIIKTFPFT